MKTAPHLVFIQMHNASQYLWRANTVLNTGTFCHTEILRCYTLTWV